MAKSNPQAFMRISEHLRELRRRMIWAIAGISVGTVAGWFLYEPVMAFITYPITSAGRNTLQLNFQTIGAAFDMKLRVALWTGILISSPWWIAQVGMFISPGLKRREKLFVTVFGLVGVALFTAGAASGVLMAPKAVDILTSFTPEGAASLLRADAYVTFYTRLVLLFGVSFLFPEALVAANFAGMIQAKTMLKGWRWAILFAFVFAAIANPLPSPWPMTIQAGILIVLFFTAVGISAFNDRLRGRRAGANAS